MNKSANESKNEKITNNIILNNNSLKEVNNKSGISFNKTNDKDFSLNSSIER